MERTPPMLSLGQLWECLLKPDSGGPGGVKGHRLWSSNPEATPFTIFSNSWVHVDLLESGQMRCPGWGLRKALPGRNISESTTVKPTPPHTVVLIELSVWRR